MSDSLIAQVRKAANRMPIIKTVEPRPLGRRQDGIQFARPEEYDELDLRVVLAHLERTQAVVDAARELWGIDMGDWYEVPAKHYEELVAALENLETNDGK